MHILGGVDQPSEGQVVVDGTVITDLKEDKLAVFRRRQVGLIYQFYNLIPVLTVEEDVYKRQEFALPFTEGVAQVGFYACSPKDSTFDAEFFDMMIESLQWEEKRNKL